MTVVDEAPLAHRLPLRCGGTIEHWAEVEDEVELVALIRQARADRWIVRPIPPFHDALPPEGGLVGLGLRLGGAFETVSEGPDGALWVGSGALLAPIGLRPGFESLRRAPGTALDGFDEGWLRPAVLSVRQFRGRGFEEVAPAPDPKALPVRLLLKPKIALKPPHAGQAFLDKRGVGAAMVRAKLAGLRVHGAALSESNPLILANRGDASVRHLRAVIAAAKEAVHHQTGLTLEERLGAPGRGGRV